MMKLQYNNDGLIPAIIQNVESGKILMLGYMNAEALALTLREKNVVFYSRSRNTLWLKGETSGNYLRVGSIHVDCDGDTLLIKAFPEGPTCHTGAESCFFTEIFTDEDDHGNIGPTI